MAKELVTEGRADPGGRVSQLSPGTLLVLIPAHRACVLLAVLKREEEARGMLGEPHMWHCAGLTGPPDSKSLLSSVARVHEFGVTCGFSFWLHHLLCDCDHSVLQFPH